MGTKEQKLKEYINKEFDCKACEYVGFCKYGQGAESAELYDCNAERHADAFESGWNEALKWVDADEQLPDFDDVENISEKRKYLVRTMYIGMKNEISYTVAYMRSWYKFSAEVDRVKVTHWMPIPSFDEILEANKDVLERLKCE